MTPTQAESIARELLLCYCNEDVVIENDGTAQGHRSSCPAHYRPAVARALVQAATLDRDALVGIVFREWAKAYKSDLTLDDARTIGETFFDDTADAILSSNGG